MESTLDQEAVRGISKPPVHDKKACEVWLRRTIGGGYLKSFEITDLSPEERTKLSVEQGLLFLEGLTKLKEPESEIQKYLREYAAAAKMGSNWYSDTNKFEPFFNNRRISRRPQPYLFSS